MSFSPEDLAQLGQFIDTKFEAVKAELAPKIAEAKAPSVGSQAADQVVEFYVHLADGSTVVLPQNEVSSHVDVEGKPVKVIAKYRVGE
jgi:hypothetical protein